MPPTSAEYWGFLVKCFRPFCHLVSSRLPPISLTDPALGSTLKIPLTTVSSLPEWPLLHSTNSVSFCCLLSPDLLSSSGTKLPHLPILPECSLSEIHPPAYLYPMTYAFWDGRASFRPKPFLRFLPRGFSSRSLDSIHQYTMLSSVDRPSIHQYRVLSS